MTVSVKSLLDIFCEYNVQYVQYISDLKFLPHQQCKYVCLTRTSFLQII